MIANMRAWALRHGPQGTGHIRNIEWGNENSFGYKADANGYVEHVGVPRVGGRICPLRRRRCEGPRRARASVC